MRLVVRDDQGNEFLKTMDELLCSEGAAPEDRADHEKRVLAAIRRGIDTEVALVEIVGGQRKVIRAALARHLEAGRIAKDGDTYTVAEAKKGAKPKKSSKAKAKARAESKPPKAEIKAESKPSKAESKLPKAEGKPPKAESKPPKAESKPTSKAKAKTKAKNRRPRKAKPTTAKTATPEERAKFDAEALRVVKEGALTTSAIRKKLGGSTLEVTSAISRLVDDGKLVISVEGPPARYKPAPAVAAKSTRGKPKLPTLKWSSTSRNGRKGYKAIWDVGVFKMIGTKTAGTYALFFQRDGEEEFEEYGCGPSREVKRQARLIAAAGVPSAEQWHAQGGQLLGDCPVAVRRVTKSKSATLTWTETIQDGRQVCVAPTADGEFKMESTKGGSFALIFVRDGDASVAELGSGKKATLLKRALEIVDEDAKDAADDEDADDDASSDDGDEADEGDETDKSDKTDEIDETDDVEADDDDTTESIGAPPAGPVPSSDQAGKDAVLMNALVQAMEMI